MRDIVLAGAAIVLLVSTMTLGRQPDCRTEVASRALAPNGKLQAIAFRHGCGTATPATELVSIFPMGGATSDVGNVFVAQGGTRTPNRIALHWLSPADLAVTYDPGARVARKHTTLGRVHIRYGPPSP
jgi:hypothetical protein